MKSRERTERAAIMEQIKDARAFLQLAGMRLFWHAAFYSPRNREYRAAVERARKHLAKTRLERAP